MIFLKIVFGFFIWLISISLSQADAFPRGCEVRGFGYDGRHLILNETGTQTLYLIQNRAGRTIELRRVEDPNVFMSPPLITRLDAEKWAAFASDIQELNFECLLSQKDSQDNKVQNIDCREALDVCQYPRVKFALSNMGNYWVTTNKTQSQVINDTAGKGILLRW